MIKLDCFYFMGRNPELIQERWLAQGYPTKRCWCPDPKPCSSATETILLVIVGDWKIPAKSHPSPTQASLRCDFVTPHVTWNQFPLPQNLDYPHDLLSEVGVQKNQHVTSESGPQGALRLPHTSSWDATVLLVREPGFDPWGWEATWRGKWSSWRPATKILLALPAVPAAIPVQQCNQF